jgi:hypothetical protein
MTTERNIINNCIALLNQAVSIINSIDDDVYAAKISILPRGSIGGHIRHVLDFYLNLLSGINQGRINYNLRDRNARLETSRKSAIERIEEITANLAALVIAPCETLLLVTTETDGLSIPGECTSSLLRELDFLQSHTIHHYSLMATLLRLHNIDPGKEFGVAPSTLAYWKEEAACAR